MSVLQTSHKAATGLNKPIRQYDPQALGNSGVVLAAPGTLVRVFGANTGSSTLWIQFFDAATVPSLGAIPVFAPLCVTAASGFDVDFNDGAGHGQISAVDFAAGIVWAASTTPGTLTVDTSSSTWVTVRYR